MAIIKCEKGHFYDDRKHTSCPYCEKGRTDEPTEQTVWKKMLEEGHIEERHYAVEKQYVQADNDLTVGVFSPQKGNDYTVGWLVCINGPDRGRDYRLHYGFNHIGRGSSMDVILENDKGISRDSHCSIIYEAKKNSFFLSPGEGEPLYYQGEWLKAPVPLHSRDTFVYGENTLEFIAFCEGERRWEI